MSNISLDLICCVALMKSSGIKSSNQYQACYCTVVSVQTLGFKMSDNPRYIQVKILNQHIYNVLCGMNYVVWDPPRDHFLTPLMLIPLYEGCN